MKLLNFDGYIVTCATKASVIIEDLDIILHPSSKCPITKLFSFKELLTSQYLDRGLGGSGDGKTLKESLKNNKEFLTYTRNLNFIIKNLGV